VVVVRVRLRYLFMFGTIRKHSQGLWIVIIVLVSISMVWFFTNTDPSAILQRGQGGTMTMGQQQVLIGAAVQFWQRSGQLPRRASELLRGEDLDGDQKADVDGIVLRGAMRQDMLERVDEMGIGFDDDAINAIIREQLSYPRGQFRQEVYDQLIKSFGEADIRQFFHDELAIRHLDQVMGLGGGMISSRAVRPLVEQSLVKYDTEVAVFLASGYTNQVTNVASRLQEYYTNNRAQYKEEDRVKFAWLKISIPTNATDPAVIKLAHKYQATIYRQFQQQQATNLTTLRQIATNLQPPLEISEIKLSVNDVASHDLSAIFSRARALNVGDVQMPAMRGPGGLYFTGVAEEIEGALPVFKLLAPARSNEVRQAFLSAETQKLAGTAGRSFHTNLTTALIEGNHTFADYCQSNKVELITVPLFSISTQPGPAYAALTNRVDLAQLQRAVSAMDTSKMPTAMDRITEFSPNANGGWILNLKQSVPPSAAEVATELNGEVLAERRRGLSEATQRHPVRGFGPQGYSIADPTWKFRLEERIKLQVYISAKKNRADEIADELEKLHQKLNALIQAVQTNAPLTPADLVRLNEEMEALRAQKIPPLERERATIAEAQKQLEELQK